MKVDILALDDASLGGLAATCDALDAANSLGSSPTFGWRIVSNRKEVAFRPGLVSAATPLDEARPADWVVVLGLGSAGPEEIEARLSRPDVAPAARWLRQAAGREARLAAACTGVFLLAEADALDGRACTTSWWLQGLLGRRAPQARILADAMVVADAPVWTAGPAYAQLDLMLAVVAECASPGLAQAVGRRLSADRRESQAAYMDPRAVSAAPSLAALEAAVSARLSERLTLSELAAAAGLSPRTLARRVQAETGLSPMRFVQKVRLAAALRLIRAGEASLGQIAAQVGLADAAALHRLVVRHTRQAPGAFRRPPGMAKSA